MATTASYQDNDAVHSLPPFANDENRSLSEKIKSMEARLNQLNTQIDDNASRSDVMSIHMKNVKQELSHTQGVYDAKCRQVDTEDHFKQLADRECGRLTVEIRRLEKETGEISDHLTTLQNNIYRGNEKIESIRTELKFDKEELDEWLRVQSEKEEDNLALLKYTKEDEAKIKELNLSIEKLVHEVNRKKVLLSAEVTETQICQTELDRATETFKQLHQERQNLINQWEDAIKNMQKSDQSISSAQTQYQTLKDVIKDKMEKIKENQRFFDQQLASNAELEKKIGMYDRIISNARLEQAEANSTLLMQRDEAEVAKNTLSKTASTLVARKSEICKLREDLQTRQAQLSKEKEQNMTLQSRYQSVQEGKGTTEAKAQELRAILAQQDRLSRILDRDLKIIKELQFKKSQDLFKLKQDEKNANAEITGGETALRNLKTKLHLLDQESLKQQAMLYSQEYQIQQLERKIRRAQGDRTDEENEILNKKIQELTSQSNVQNKRYTLLSVQLKKAQDDLRQAKRRLEHVSTEKQTVIDNINELRLYNESASSQLSNKVKEKEELMVEENIRRLEIRKLRGYLNARADEVFGLESRQVGLQLALEARTKEIDIHKDILRVQMKNANEERQAASSELRDRVSKIEKLKKRYEILMTQFAPEDGEEEHSQAYFVIKAAQQREELQREGDQLDAAIQKAEKEIKALENTLILMNNRNQDYRKNIYQAELDSKDIQHKEMLEVKYREVMEKYKSKREVIQDFQQQVMQMERSLSSVNNDESKKLQEVQILQKKIASLSNEIEQLHSKKERAKKSVSRCAELFHKKVGANAKDALPEEKDFAIRKARELASVTLQEVSKLVESVPDISPVLEQLLENNGLQAPSRTLSRVSSRASSLRDDMSEVSFGSNLSLSRKSGLVQSHGLYRPVREPSPHGSSGTATPTLVKKISLNDLVQLPDSNSSSGGSRSNSSAR